MSTTTDAPVEETTSAPANGNDPASRLRDKIIPEMQRTLVQRDEEIRLLVLSLIARTHLALIGKPGIAKSLALDNFMSHVSDDVRMFKKTIRKGTNVEELFGPPSVKRMIEDDVFEFQTANTLVEANIAMLSEIWKGNSALLNSLLRVINERQFENGTNVVDVPLWSLIADSNELPPPNENDLMAMRDRFGATKIVEPVRTRDGLLSVLDTQLAHLSGHTVADSHTTIASNEIVALQAKVAEVAEKGVGREVRQAYADLQLKAANEGLEPSARRTFEGIKLACANAVLNGRTKLVKGDLKVFAHNLWTFPEEAKTAEKLVLDFADKAAKQAARHREALEEITREVNAAANKLPQDGSAPDASLFGEIGVQNANLQNLRKKVERDRDDAHDAGDDSSELDSVAAQIEQTQAVVKKALYAEE